MGRYDLGGGEPLVLAGEHLCVDLCGGRVAEGRLAREEVIGDLIKELNYDEPIIINSGLAREEVIGDLIKEPSTMNRL